MSYKCQPLNHLRVEDETQALGLLPPLFLHFSPCLHSFFSPFLPLDMCHILGFCSLGINARLHGVVFLSVVH